MERRAGTIFLKKPTGQLESLTETRYETEDSLQELIATHHELLGGEQIDDEAPRRWLLVGREVRIPDTEGGADRWSIDHVFVDQDAIPTLVEVKRSSDARIRREVVGQLLEYAANAARNWPTGFLKDRAASEALAKGRELVAAVREILDDAEEHDEFWTRVEQNLRTGNIRLLFVADKIPPELRRMAEFMNEQMTKTEVLAIEVRRYLASDGHSALVPYVLNVTESAKETKSTSRARRRPPLAAENFFSALAQRAPGSELVAKRLIEKLEAMGCSLHWRQSGVSIRLEAPTGSGDLFTICVLKQSGECEVGWLVRAEQRGLDPAIAQRYIRSLIALDFAFRDNRDFAPPRSLLSLKVDEFAAAARSYIDDLRAAVNSPPPNK